MPSILTHPAVPLALGFGLGQRVISKRLLVAGIVASALPDADVLAFKFGIAYSDPFGHRGFSHSFLFAAVIALAGACAARHLHTHFARAFWFLFIATASHGVLDAFTNGGGGIAFLWPFSDERFLGPWRIIEVSPLGIAPFFSARGVRVLVSELLTVWLPCGMFAWALAQARRRRGPPHGID